MLKRDLSLWSSIKEFAHSAQFSLYLFCVNCCQVERLAGAGRLGVGVTKLPFSLGLVSSTGQPLVETYHGVQVVATYTLK